MNDAVGTETELSALRASAVEARTLPAGDKSTLAVATGFVMLWQVRGHKQRFPRLAVDGVLLHPSFAVYEALESEAPYRVYFVGQSVRGVAPLPPEERPSAIADAVRAQGLAPDDPNACRDPRVLSRLRQEIVAHLQRVEAFSEADLVSHRMGRHSPASLAKLGHHSLGLFVISGMFLAVGALALGLGGLTLGTLLASALALGIGSFLGRIAWRQGRARSVSEVKSELARFEREISGSGLARLVTPSGQSLSMSLLAFSLGGHPPRRLMALEYRVHFVEGTQVLLSIEPGPDLGPLFGDTSR